QFTDLKCYKDFEKYSKLKNTHYDIFLDAYSEFNVNNQTEYEKLIDALGKDYAELSKQIGNSDSAKFFFQIIKKYCKELDPKDLLDKMKIFPFNFQKLNKFMFLDINKKYLKEVPRITPHEKVLHVLTDHLGEEPNMNLFREHMKNTAKWFDNVYAPDQENANQENANTYHHYSRRIQTRRIK